MENRMIFLVRFTDAIYYLFFWIIAEMPENSQLRSERILAGFQPRISKNHSILYSSGGGFCYSNFCELSFLFLHFSVIFNVTHYLQTHSFSPEGQKPAP